MALPKYNQFIQVVISALSEDSRVLFAYLYGSVADRQKGNDIAIYAVSHADHHQLSVDLKIALHKKTGLSPETFNIRVINELAEQGDIFGLLYLKNLLSSNRLLIDKDPDTRADFLYRYGLRFRECESLMQEVVG